MMIFGGIRTVCRNGPMGIGWGMVGETVGNVSELGRLENLGKGLS